MFAALIVQHARRCGLLAPVAVGFLLRAAAMLAIHVASVSSGDAGFLFTDEHRYFDEAAELAQHWRAGTFAQPTDIADSYQSGFQALQAVVYTLTGPSLFAGKALNVLIGTSVVTLAGLLAGQVLGHPAGRVVAWVTACMPALVFWSASGLKEPVVTWLVVAAVLAVLARPRWLTLLAALGALAALGWVRGVAALALVAAMVVVFALAISKLRSQVDVRRLGLVAGAFAALGATVITLVAGGRPAGLVSAYSGAAERMFETYQAGGPSQIPGDLVRTITSPRPWVFGANGAQGWYRALYPDVVVLFLVYPLAVLGSWRLRRRLAAVLLAVAIVAFVLVYAIVTGSGVRQRSMIEPLLIVLAVGCAPSWRLAATIGSGSLVVAAGAAALTGGSAWLATGILASAGALWGLSHRLPPARLVISVDGHQIERVVLTALRKGPRVE